MANKQWYIIYLTTEEGGEPVQDLEIARVRSKGLAYGTLQFYKEHVYNRPTDKLTIR